ncbi:MULTISPECIES: DUF2971 domain-containing protein [Sporomusa]|jgi:hypothetical protein|uniref:DUF2971 domain-containing protein n=1 Tax=Sporomusa sphaeroides DSM 2875 TaxID=1337886 RepID=A0ABM9W2B0_9FIRM|nr:MULTISPECIES: DUF2971 domain-containing protein [Sporomusa]OLS56300.1 hypothetical protein SPSPH_26930 [Sporomusa sphaeroides DSM 2875]CVK18396.1 hypothetical protein SSPH_01034 [Sporomusa sphaeroides DSM 2875]HML33887.1 DUF2971 domain-containing protein [Sporomusa sphaeroides]
MILYKYLTPDRIDVLQNCMVRYTQPGAFNDPFEVKPYISKLSEEQEVYNAFDELMPKVLREKYDELPREFQAMMSFDMFYKKAQEELRKNAKALFHKIVESNAPMVRKMLDEGFNDKIGILSLTEKQDNLLMWAHYAASHEGFVIGFDANNLYFHEEKGLKGEFRHLRKIEYREKRPALPMLEMSGTDMFLVKSTQWSYEQEWRIIRPLQEASKIIQASPYSIHLFQFPANAVKEVIFGSRMSDEKKKEITSILSDSFRHVQIKQAEPDEIEFNLKMLYITR